MVWPLIDILVTEVQSLPAYNNILDKRGLKRNIWVTELTSPLTKKKEKKRINLPCGETKKRKKKHPLPVQNQQC